MSDEQVGWWDSSTRRFYGMDDGEYPTEADYGPGFKRVFVRGDAAVSPEPGALELFHAKAEQVRRQYPHLFEDAAVEPPQPSLTPTLDASWVEDGETYSVLFGKLVRWDGSRWVDAPAGIERSPQPSPDCTNCDGTGCMSCVMREIHDACVNDCPFCCGLPQPPLEEPE